MSFLGDLAGSFTGSTAKKATETGYNNAKTALNQGKTEAAQAYDTAYDRGSWLSDRARTYSTDTKLWGMNKALDATAQGYGAGIGTLQTAADKVDALGRQTPGQFDAMRTAQNEGYDAANAAASGGNQAAQSKLNPWGQSGFSSDQMMAAISGTLGPEAQAAAYQQFQSNPLTKARDDAANKQLQAQANARGGGLSGSALMAVARASQQRQMQDLNQFATDFWNPSAARGLSADSQAASGDLTTANALANLEASRGNNLATTGLAEVNQGNNILNSQLGVARDIAGQQIGQGTTSGNILSGTSKDIADSAGQYDLAHLNTAMATGNNLGSLYGSYGNTLAQLDMNKAQQDAQNGGIFAKNIIGLTGAVAGAMTGNPLSGLGRGQQIDYQPGTALNGGWETSTFRAR